MTLVLKMTVLLRPQLPVDRAAFEQHAMWRKIDDLALLHHHDRVRIQQD